MSQTYFALLTALGEAKLANAAALGTQLQISRMAVGDGNGNLPTPVRTQTALINERYRADLNNLSVDPANASQVIAELVIPEAEGGYWLREMGLFDAAGDMIAVSNCPPSYKPQMAEGSGRTQVLRMVLIVSSTAAVQLKIDPSVVLATRAYVDGLTVRADQAEAEAGTENSKIMTALRVAQAIAKTVKQATESAFGWAKIATQAQVTTGTDDATMVTPKKLRGAQATQAEAEAGTDNSKTMTPQRVFQAIGKYKVVTSVSADTVLTAAHRGLVLVDASAGARTVTLPAADAALGVVELAVRRVDVSNNALIVAAASTDKIMLDTTAIAAGQATTELLFAGDYLHLRSDGSGKWWCVGQAQLPASITSVITKYQTAGVFTYTVPAVFRSGRRRAKVTVTGAGAGGGHTESASLGGGGGGGGGRGTSILDLTGQTSITTTIGAPGVGGASGAANSGTVGSSSSFGVLLSSTGGGAGSAAGSSGASGTTTGDIIHPVPAAGAGTASTIGHGGGNGGSGKILGWLKGDAGLSPGGGGAGGAGTSGTRGGGNGAPGEVLIEVA
ncbi:phage tail protein [Pseudomonas taiwanensis]|uniref:phage tail protein n=1 Tax=Pseudomonas taiwanensis TaxID=470150 RepID=UPI001645A691|nr:phage tail protein [Pseudomonas taiwanensis]MBC3489901.1 phage tail protein [Pseudomonas taiwanensis]